ncbi:MAG: hypothetical protein FJ318_09855 [SAR202 cluster bacterium]|nr:hypothetical protein [SAR202 cluster bacterium]
MATPTIGRGGSHHALLRDLPSGGSTTLGIVLAKDRGGKLLWRKRRLQAMAERRLSGPLTYSDLYPGIALMHSQNDWSGGALQPVADPAMPNRYAHASGVDAARQAVVGGEAGPRGAQAHRLAGMAQHLQRLGAGQGRHRAGAGGGGVRSGVRRRRRRPLLLGHAMRLAHAGACGTVDRWPAGRSGAVAAMPPRA